MLVGYSSSDSDGDVLDTSFNGYPQCKSSKIGGPSMTSTTSNSVAGHLPKAAALLGAAKRTIAEEPAHDYGQQDHNGRIRSFKHERGNLATFVYIPVKSSLLDDVGEQCQRLFADGLELHASDDLHISLSRTVVLQHHLIDSFVKSLEEALIVTGRFSLSLAGLKVYTNEERTRTFIALKVGEIFTSQLKRLLAQVDAVMKDFKLSHFYDDPCFHVSFLWCVGDCVEAINARMDEVDEAIRIAVQPDQESDAEQADGVARTLNTTTAGLHIDVRAVLCKTGNKNFTFLLS